MASYIPNFHGPYLWKSGLHVAIFQALGLSRVLGLGDYLHVIGVIRHYGSLADGLVTFWPAGTVVVWHVNVSWHVGALLLHNVAFGFLSLGSYPI